MNKEEYLKLMKEDDSWAPGWDAITTAFEILYPNQEPHHLATEVLDRAMFGGDNYLDGYSVYTSLNGYRHILSYGFSELYAHEDNVGAQESGWGYELTGKIKEANAEDCIWFIDMLSRMAYYTFTQNRPLGPFQFINIGRSVKSESDSAITGLLVVPDTEVPSINTIHGKVQFLQLVGITNNELAMLTENRNKAPTLMQKLQELNPYLYIDLSRNFDVLF